MGKILKLLVPIVIVTTMSALSEAVAKNVAYGNQLIRIYFLSFFSFWVSCLLDFSEVRNWLKRAC